MQIVLKGPLTIEPVSVEKLAQLRRIQSDLFVTDYEPGGLVLNTGQLPTLYAAALSKKNGNRMKNIIEHNIPESADVAVFNRDGSIEFLFDPNSAEKIRVIATNTLTIPLGGSVSTIEDVVFSIIQIKGTAYIINVEESTYIEITTAEKLMLLMLHGLAHFDNYPQLTPDKSKWYPEIALVVGLVSLGHYYGLEAIADLDLSDVSRQEYGAVFIEVKEYANKENENANN